MNEKFLWKEGDIVLEKSEIELTEEQKMKAKKVLVEVLEEFERFKRLKETEEKMTAEELYYETLNNAINHKIISVREIIHGDGRTPSVEFHLDNGKYLVIEPSEWCNVEVGDEPYEFGDY